MPKKEHCFFIGNGRQQTGTEWTISEPITRAIIPIKYSNYINLLSTQSSDNTIQGVQIGKIDD